GMSFDINWSTLESDNRLNDLIRKHLNSYLQNTQLPSYVSNLRVLDFDLGKVGPAITLKEITDPLDEFYDSIREEGGSGGSPNDIQFLLEVEYKGDLLVTIGADLVLNYPVEKFMTLPVKLSISDIGLHSLCIVACLSKQLFLSFLCDVSDPALDDNQTVLDPKGPILAATKPLERISIVRSMKIETEIGEQYQGQGSVLRSVGELEQFLFTIFKDFLRKELAWPSWINLDFNDGDE
uniref:Mitochondrial distribution and morphology protein 12 n=1 Tax=Saccharomyces cerevisiae (strain ATCC 204508 / S288c) TaxID=559292 RepID=UPI0008FBBF71|nr:Chain A, Mitochondrial distribution and morphology protein 12 [Saccharomyces cerevisiae S288C]5GYK_B Chain B, Mitochondrial distribution and morphology protein 12 [Saccharomyces cerevisiae S288C]5GYK_C Chain C, Mitochondrial distribution and morphology protein 12 [Saccharomyces cerevisiae S288C]5GYK_D Chain D, Mitochondrial distribution and morphology protein 12 [Saccharomyces cerevisiae S288C]5GYK_E Chain E, Mitochondrial distribution and morphology protein 12 [Saccharomyces cerevisiae S288